ncbi:MAG: hypothetical protein LBL34_04710 [Clostridiales bacterium]|nr:hypothetical protein [Clostridiales bacterium]
MTKFRKMGICVFMMAVLFCGNVKAAGGDLLIYAPPPSDFTDYILFTISNTTGYTRTETLKPATMFTSQLYGLEVGEYYISAAITNPKEPDNFEDYENEKYRLHYNTSFRVREGQAEGFEIAVVSITAEVTPTPFPVITDFATPGESAVIEVPATSGGDVPPVVGNPEVSSDPLATPRPTLSPTPVPLEDRPTIGGMVWLIVKRSWFTMTLAAIAGLLWAGYKLRQSIYKD